MYLNITRKLYGLPLLGKYIWEETTECSRILLANYEFLDRDKMVKGTVHKCSLPYTGVLLAKEFSEVGSSLGATYKSQFAPKYPMHFIYSALTAK